MSVFPAEIYDLIVEECDQSALARLARLDKAFQERCERLLYHSVSTESPLKRGKAGALERLAESQRKAGYLKTLSVRFKPSRQTSSKFAPTLALVLKNAVSLVELRILGPFKAETLVEIAVAIGQGHFGLDTLIIPNPFLLATISLHRQRIKSVGVVDAQAGSVLRIVNQMNHMDSIPDIMIASDGGQVIDFILTTHSLAYVTNKVALERRLERLLLPYSTVEPLARSSILRLGVYAKDLSPSNLAIMSELFRALKKIYTRATLLEISFTSSDGILNDETAAAFASFDGLQEIYFTEISDTSDMWGHDIGADVGEEGLRKWRAACPRLRYVSFAQRTYASSATNWEVRRLGY
ncbi:hypothetical protein BKA70DRAFT_1280434 [Coprinopsis sp. MPI-PUGE-AT-0042]|nr:hypothetical protein BKA70DRAFT_1280434 [Coprinopsis sp. MPI-PUGE-AT-0042]